MTVGTQEILVLLISIINLTNRTRFWCGNLTERDHWGDQDVDGKKMLRLIFRKWEGVVGIGWVWLRIGTGGGRYMSTVMNFGVP